MFMHRKLVKVNEYMRKLDNNKYKLTKKDFAFVENTVKALRQRNLRKNAISQR